MDRDTILLDRDVLIAGNRIVAIVPASRHAPTGVSTIDGTGKYVIPGLWDSHVHALDLPIEVAQRLLAFGITSVRDMGSLGDSLPFRRAAWQSMPSGTPRLWAAGPLIDGPRQRWSHAIAWHLTDPTGAEQVVDSLTRLGADFVKVYNTLSRPSYLALAAAATQRGLPIAGHLPFTVSTSDALAVGQRSFEHAGPELVSLDCVVDGKARYSRLLGVWGARGYGAYLAGLDSLRRDREPGCTRNLQAQLAERGAFIVPTIVNAIRDSLTVNWRALAQVDSASRAACDGTIEMFHAATDAQRQRYHQDFLEDVGTLHRRGATLVAGTDFPNACVVPGASLHDELAWLTRAGMAPYEALRAATVNAARLVAADDSLGTLRPGMLADLVVLSDDPRRDVRAVASIVAVVKDGRVVFRRDQGARSDSSKPGARLADATGGEAFLYTRGRPGPQDVCSVVNASPGKVRRGVHHPAQAITDAPPTPIRIAFISGTRRYAAPSGLRG